MNPLRSKAKLLSLIFVFLCTSAGLTYAEGTQSLAETAAPIEAGIAIAVTSPTTYDTTVDRSKLPAAMQDFVYIAVQTNFSKPDPAKLPAFAANAKFTGVFRSGVPAPGRFYPVVVLFDGGKKPLGYYIGDIDTRPTAETLLFNQVQLAVNGVPARGNTISYQGTTYVPLRQAAELLGAEIQWDAAANTVRLNVPKAASVPTESAPQAGGTTTLKRGEIARIAANPKAGFNYDYYLYLPAEHAPAPLNSLLVEMNNSGTVSDVNAFHAERALELLKHGTPRRLADRLHVPALVPIVDRPLSKPELYTHALDRDSLLEKDGKLARVDLQVASMIADAQERLRSAGVPVQEKVWMTGFSASGTFANRFAALHPELVKAVAAGGVNAMPLLPTESVNGTTLPFPAGVGDLQSLAGDAFDADAYREVAQYLYMGADDTNDTLYAWDAYGDAERAATEKVLGKRMGDRWKAAKDIFGTFGFDSIQTVTYAGVGHWILPEMEADIAEFFETNGGEEAFAPIVPHRY